MRQKIRIINGVLNYTLAAFLIAAPVFFSVSENLTGNLVLILAGLISLTIGLVSDYELSIIKSIKYKDNLIANIVLGVCLLISPFTFDFADSTLVPHLMFGTLQIVLPLFAYKIHFGRKRNGFHAAALKV